MKLIEAMKELKLISKKMFSNNEQLIKLSSILSTERPLVGDNIKDQAKEVASLLQSNEDLFSDYLSLKLRIEKTNNSTLVTVNSLALTITEWLTFKRNNAEYMAMFVALNTRPAQQRLERLPANDKHSVEVIPCYDEAVINKKKMGIVDTIGKLDGVLEVINATTDLVD